jgi:hypothetical protein
LAFVGNNVNFLIVYIVFKVGKKKLIVKMLIKFCFTKIGFKSVINVPNKSIVFQVAADSY